MSKIALNSAVTVRDAEIRRLSIAMGVQADEIERLRAALHDIAIMWRPELDPGEVVVAMQERAKAELRRVDGADGEQECHD